MWCKGNAQKGEEGAKQAAFGMGCGTAGCFFPRDQKLAKIQRLFVCGVLTVEVLSLSLTPPKVGDHLVRR